MKEKLDILAPFMGDPIALKVGLNQLGMRSVGEQLFTALLPGLNNVTEPLRGYAFYCWILNSLFGDTDLQKITLEDFREYIRTAEYLLALVCADQEKVPGVTLAREFRAKQLVLYFLADGTKGTETNGKYFKNPGGAFLQYFASSMVDMGLVHSVPDKRGKPTLIYNTTPRGRALGEEFGKALGKEAEEIFFSAHGLGQVRNEQLATLRERIDMHKPSKESNEWQMFVSLLTGADFPEREHETFHRRQTMKFALEWIETGPKELKDMNFVRYLLQLFHSSKERNATLWGWYAYAVNEAWQYQSSFVFSELLQKYLEPEGARWHKTDEVVEKMAQDIALAIGATQETLLSETIDKAEGMQTATLPPAAKAVAALLRNYKRNEKMMTELQPLHDAFANLTPDSFFAFMRKISERRNEPTASFLKFYIKQEIIMRHYKESFRKMNLTGIATQKFVMESGLIRFLARIDVDHSSPRLGTLINFVRDLGLVAENRLTEAGRALLNELRK